MGLFLRFPSHPHPSRLGTVAKEVAISADTLGSKLTQMTAPAGNRNGTGCCSGRARSSTQAVVCLNSQRAEHARNRPQNRQGDILGRGSDCWTNGVHLNYPSSSIRWKAAR